MGVDFYGYSFVRTEPLPKKFRGEKRDPAELEAERRKLMASIRADPEVASLVLVLSGASIGTDGRLIMPDTPVVSDELREEFYTTIGNEPDFLGVDWDTGIIWRSTEETKIASAGRSYSGYGDFRQCLRDLNGGRPLLYMPPSTDTAPENGYVSADRCRLCLEGLDRLRAHFVPADWKPNPEGGDGDGDTVDDKDELHADSWFFRQFYTTMWIGAQSGMVRIS
jgi:hypothetical protein